MRNPEVRLPLPDHYLPEWMTQLCECGHVSKIHEEGGRCLGRTPSTMDVIKCGCQEFVHRPISNREKALVPPKRTRGKNKVR